MEALKTILIVLLFPIMIASGIITSVGTVTTVVLVILAIVGTITWQVFFTAFVVIVCAIAVFLISYASIQLLGE